MIKTAHAVIFRITIIVLLVFLNYSCQSKIKKKEAKMTVAEIKVMQVKIDSNLQRLITADLVCFRKNFSNLLKLKKITFFYIYAEKEANGYNIAVSSSEILEIGQKCNGFFYIDSVIFTIYGDFVPELYQNLNYQNLKVDNLQKNQNKKEFIHDEMISWHYKYKNDTLTYLIENTCFQVDSIRQAQASASVSLVQR